MRIMKRIRSLVFLGIFAVLMAFSVMAAPDSGNVGVASWQGNIDFWESQVGNTTKTFSPNSGKSYYNFSSTESGAFYLYLTVKDNDTVAKTVTAKTKIYLGNDANVPTEAMISKPYKLVAAREYVLDTKMNCSGTWRP